MSDQFNSPKRRLEQAEKHISTLERRIKKFFKKKPYTRLIEPDTDGIHKLHKIRLTKCIPKGFTDLAYDAIEKLRSALDQSTYSVAVACGSKHLDRIQFPIAGTARDFNKTLSSRCKDLPPSILALLCDFKPYKGGNDVIWALNEIRRQGYHRLLVPVCTSTTGTHIHRMTISGSGSFPSPKWDGEKNEMLFFRAHSDSQFDYSISFTFFIAFGEVEGLAGEQVVPFLKVASEEVRRIVYSIETETKNIGLI